MKIAFLVMATANHPDDDQLAVTALVQRGHQVDLIEWTRKDIDWNSYDQVIIRSSYDYIEQPQDFLQVLERISQSKARLANPLEVVRWNLQKDYLIALADHQVNTIPTQISHSVNSKNLSRYFREFNTNQLVIKPLVGASGHGVVRIGSDADSTQLDQLFFNDQNSPHIIQPFIPQILSSGEYSLIFFNKIYSHAVQKKPSTNEFRIQAEYGGSVAAISVPNDAITCAQKAIAYIQKPLLYARVDLVRIDANQFALMELELIEPELFFRTDPAASNRFAAAIEDL